MPEGWGHFLGQLVGCLRTGDAYGGHVLEEIVHGHGFSISSGLEATIGEMDLGELEVKLASRSINELVSVIEWEIRSEFVLDWLE